MAEPSSSTSSSTAKTAKEIKFLLSQIRKSKKKKQKKHNAVDSDDDKEDAIRYDKLRKIFGTLIEHHEFDLNGTGSSSLLTSANNNNATTTSNVNGTDDGDKVSVPQATAGQQYKNWLINQHATFTTYLLEDITTYNTLSSVRTYCGMLASSPVNISGVSSGGTGDGMISERLLNKLLESIFKVRSCFIDNNITPSTTTKEEEEEDIAEEQLVLHETILTFFENEFVKPYYDVQYFVYKGIHSIVLNLIAGLERIAQKKNSSSKKKDDEGEEEEEDSSDDADALVLQARAERNAGLIAENICRLLLMMEYVPTSSTTSELEDGASGRFLFVPPVLSTKDNVDEEEYDEKKKNDQDDEEDSEAESSESSSSDDDESDDEDSTNKKRKKKNQRANNNNKRSKKKKNNLISWQQSYKHRHAHQEAWLSVLRIPNIPMRTQKRILEHVSTYVLRICPSPLRFAEYFTMSFKGGTTSTTANNSSVNNSLTSILSLHGLFTLILQHQLEYPQYYNSLYQLLHPRILYTKHRTRFLKLLSTSLLSNSMLPAYVVASFCKKLLRMGLSGPPSGALFVLALVSNLLRKFGECGCLVHRKGSVEDGGLIDDVFVEDVDDLIKTRGEFKSFNVLYSFLFLPWICFSTLYMISSDLAFMSPYIYL